MSTIEAESEEIVIHIHCKPKQETQLSLTNRATHLRKYNGVTNLNDGATGPRKKFDDIFSCLHIILRRDRQIPGDRQDHAFLRIALHGKNHSNVYRPSYVVGLTRSSSSLAPEGSGMIRPDFTDTRTRSPDSVYRHSISVGFLSSIYHTVLFVCFVGV